MDSIAKPRHRSLPQLDDERRSILTSAFLSLYAADEQFQAELQSFVDQHTSNVTCCGNVYANHGAGLGWFTLEAHARYGDNEPTKQLASVIHLLVTKWGLDRLPDGIGYEALTREVSRLVRYPGTTVMLLHVGMYFIPHVEGEDVSVDEWPRPLPVSFDSRWHPAQETPSQAIERLEHEFASFVRAEIHDGIRRLGAAGYDYDDAWMTHVYLRWLYRRVALREPVEDIASSEGAKISTVETETKKYRKLIGIKRIPDYKGSRRGKR